MHGQDLAAGVNLFQGLVPEQLQVLSGIAVRKTATRGQGLFQEGEEALGFFSVIRGKVRIYKTSLSGKEQILHLFGPGEAFAEVAMFAGRTYPASAQALEDAELVFFPRRDFLRALRESPELAMNMLALLSERLRVFARRIEDLTLKEAPARLAAHLLLLAAANNADAFDLDLPKGQLASYLGATPETLSRILKKMAEQDLIVLRGPRVALQDVELLRALAEGQHRLD